MRKPLNLKALIFDVDGTLAETEELHRFSFNKAFQDQSMNWYWSKEIYKVLLQVAGGIERISHYASDFGLKESSLSIEDIHKIHNLKTKTYTNLVKETGIILRPGIKELIESAKRSGLIVAAATATSYPNLDILCKKAFGFSAKETFKATATGDEVVKKKPAPDLFLLALKKLGIDSCDALAFEDSRNGLISAKLAGITTLICPSTYTLEEGFEEADFLCKSHKEIHLPQFLKEKLFTTDY